MLKRLRIGNFRNLINVEFRPVGLNLLIGRNNAGKTNLSSALRFLSLTSLTDLVTAARDATGDAWNLANAYVKDKTIEFEVEVSIREGKQTLEFQYSLTLSTHAMIHGEKVPLKVEKEQLRLTGAGFQQTSLLECDRGKVRLLHEPNFLGKHPQPYVATTAPPDETMLRRLYDLDTNSRANLFKRYLHGWFYYNLAPQAMRSPRVVHDRPLIIHDGSNLSKAMHVLHNEHPRTERQVIEALRVVEPKVDVFSFAEPDPDSVYLFLEDKERNRFGPQSMSDGTLRFLTLAYLVCTLADPGQPRESTPLVIFEEPENGLYVGLLRSLLDKIAADGSSGQFIFTSHSPYFIDLFEKNLQGVHLLKPGSPSSVLVQPDPAKLAKLLEEMPLGELHFREMIT